MEQSAVEWLENEIQKKYVFNQDDFDMLKQAKEMEKQQIIDAYSEAYVNGLMNDNLSAEQYYNETFNKQTL